MNQAVSISGGMGRVVSAIPALVEHGGLAIKHGWDEIYALAGIKAIESTSSYIEYALDGMDIVTPEIYHRADYRDGQINMIDATCRELGVKVNPDRQYLRSCQDNKTAWVDKLAKVTQLPLAIIQCKSVSHMRSMPQVVTERVIEAVTNLGYQPVIVGGIDFEPKAYVINETSVTDLVSLIDLGDVFIGVDSSGMHIRNALKKKGVIYLAGTSGNLFFPESFVELKPKNTVVEIPRMFAGETTKKMANQLNAEQILHEPTTFDFEESILKSIK